MSVEITDHLAHYGILRKSGRYPWGSGGNASTRNRSFLDIVAKLHSDGLSDAKIAEGFGITTTQLRAAKSIAIAQQRQERIAQAQRLKDKGYGYSAIGQRMGIGESSVRALLAPGAKDKADVLQSIAGMLKREVGAKKYVDIGHGVELGLPIATDAAALSGVSRERMNAAVAILREEGYKVHYVKVPQQTNPGKFTHRIVLSAPEVPYSEVYAHRGEIKLINETSPDHGRTFDRITPPVNISSKRVAVKYGPEGGANADGVIYLRRDAKDLSLGKAHYAQVRIAIDGTHYIKGMAIHRDDLPDGVDIVFNTNKKSTGNKLDALKPFEKDIFGNIDPVNPFGADISRQRGALNIINEEGEWDTWSKNLSSQVLSKQSPSLARGQLAMTYERRQREFEEIKALTHPVVRRKLLEEFADSTDAASVHLKAAHLPGQETRIILPVPSLRANEVYSPSHADGTRVALIRFPHAGRFEIPELTVNNRNREARSLLGTVARDAVGINPKVAQHLSGADFDGDFILVIPNNSGKIKIQPALEGLKNFDPQHSYPKYDGMKVMTKQRKQPEMGMITNLIADMSLQGAPPDEMARAVRHSMVVIDSEKHELDYKGSEKANGIAQLRSKYQHPEGKSKAGGAATIITRATSEKRVPERRLRRAKEGGPVDRETGKLVYVPTGASYVDKKGRVIQKTTKTTKLGDAADAYDIIKDHVPHPMEAVYADHSNRLKALANEARKEAVNTQSPKINIAAKAAHPKEVASLNAKLNRAKKNAPLERQAQSLAEAIVSQKRQAWPNLEPAEIKKIKKQALDEARIRTGARKNRIEIEDSEWLAIQDGAISASKLRDILLNADMEIVRKLATPRVDVLMTSTKTARAKQMAASGATQAEIAAALGVSLTTLKNSINA